MMEQRRLRLDEARKLQLTPVQVLPAGVSYRRPARGRVGGEVYIFDQGYRTAGIVSMVLFE
jgi:hypothetical protein